MTPLEALVETTVGKLRLRIARPADDDHSPEGMASLHVALVDKPLWVTLAIDDVETIQDIFSGAAAQLEDPDWIETAEFGVCLYGATWEKLSPNDCGRQVVQFGVTPDWAFDVPLEQLWRLRGVVWGADDITRTAVALAACRAYAQNVGGRNRDY